MIYLNILPQKEKKVYQLASLNRLVNYYIFVILSIVIFLVLIFFGAKYFLVWRINIFEQSIASQEAGVVAHEIEKLETKIKDVNDFLLAVKSISSQNVSFVDVLDGLSTIASERIHFEDIVYKFIDEGVTGEFILVGKADKREDFVSFLERLEDSVYFKEVDSPLANLVKKENLNFQIEFKLENSK